MPMSESGVSGRSQDGVVRVPGDPGCSGGCGGEGGLGSGGEEGGGRTVLPSSGRRRRVW